MAILTNPWLIAGVATIVLLPIVVFIADAILNAKGSSGAADEPPVWRGGWPLISHFLKFAKNPIMTIREGYETCGSVFTLRFLGFNFTFLIGADAQTPFFRANDNELSQNEPYKFMTPIFGEGIVFDAPPDIKDQQLRFVAHALKGTALKTYVPKIVEEAETYFKSWGDSGEIDLLDAMSYLTILTASSCLLGREVRENLFGEVYHLLREIDEGINPIAIINPHLPLPSFRRRDVARKKLAEVFGTVIRARRAATGDKPVDMLQNFIDAEYRDGSRCTDDQIVGMLVGALFAGQHTSSITSTWTILNLMHKPDLMARAMTEVVTTLGTTDGARNDVMSMTNVQNMNFLHNAMKESLRLAPPLIMLMRMSHVPVKVGKYTIPVGHYVFVSPAVTMNLPETAPDHVFKNPDAFDPDRYNKGREEDKTPFSFCAFGGGKHGCLGEQFGYLQVKTIVAMLLRKFEIEPLGPLPSPNYHAMVVGPVQANKATMIRYKRRTTPLPAPAGFVEAPILTAQ